MIDPAIKIEIIKQFDEFLRSKPELELREIVLFSNGLNQKIPRKKIFIEKLMAIVERRIVAGYYVPHYTGKSIFQPIIEEIQLSVRKTQPGKQKKKNKAKPKSPKSLRYEKQNKEVRDKFEELKSLNAQKAAAISSKSSVWILKNK